MSVIKQRREWEGSLWWSIIRQHKTLDHSGKLKPLEWAEDDRVVELFVSEHDRELKRIGASRGGMDAPTMHYIIDCFNRDEVFPDLHVEPKGESKQPMLSARPVNWESPGEKIDLTLRLALASSEIPDPDERLMILNGREPVPGTLVERAKAVAGKRNKSLEEFLRDVHFVECFDLRDDWEYLDDGLHIWWHGARWFAHQEQNAEIAMYLRENPGRERVGFAGVYNGEELCGLVVDLKELHGIRRPLYFEGTDYFTPNPERMMFPKTKDMIKRFGEEAFDRWFEVCGISLCRPKKELLDQVTLTRSWDIIEPLPGVGYDVLVVNETFGMIPEEKKEASLENAVASVRSGGVLFTENASYADRTWIHKARRAIEGYVTSRSDDLQFEKKVSSNASYVIRKD